MYFTMLSSTRFIRWSAASAYCPNVSVNRAMFPAWSRWTSTTPNIAFSILSSRSSGVVRVPSSWYLYGGNARRPPLLAVAACPAGAVS